MKVLLLGAAGQVGRALQASCPQGVDLVALDRSGCDLSQPEAIAAAVVPGVELVINAAAYTQVDRAESEPERAHRINAEAPREIAERCRRIGARMVQISTDFVFDGPAERPRRPDDPVAPRSVYARTKYAGEQAVRERLGDQGLVLRTAWVYSMHGRNFLTTMLRLLREREVVKVVDDQIGTPTAASSVAAAIWQLAVTQGFHGGVWHWTDAGVASWYDFAHAISETAARHWPEARWGRVEPIPSSEYPTPAARPGFSVLDKAAAMRVVPATAHWRTRLHIELTQGEQAGRGADQPVPPCFSL